MDNTDVLVLQGLPPCVLVVDDEPLVLAMLSLALPHLGMEVLPASGGAEALDLLRWRPTIALVLADVRMRQPDGLAILAEVRGAGLRRPPVCLMTGDPTLDSNDLLALGAASVLKKPFGLAVLASTLRRVLGRRRGDHPHRVAVGKP